MLRAYKRLKAGAAVPCPYKNLASVYYLARLDSCFFVGGVLRVAAHGD